MDYTNIQDIKNRIKKIDNVRAFLKVEIRHEFLRKSASFDELSFILALEHIDSYYLLTDLFFDEKECILRQERYNEKPYPLYEVKAVEKNNRKISVVFLETSSLQDYLKNIPSYSIVYDKDKNLLIKDEVEGYVVNNEQIDSELFHKKGIEFFMNLTEVASSLSRGDLIVANYQFDSVKNQVLNMVKLYIYIKYEKKVSVGRFGQDIMMHLDEEYLDLYQEIFHTGSLEEFWSAMFNAASIYRKLGLEISRKKEFDYPKKEDVETMNYLRFLYDNFGRNI